MTEVLKAYPAYRDSRVPWLGDVPQHWEVNRLKSRVAQINEAANDRPADEIYIALEHVESWTGRLRGSTAAETFDGQVKRFAEGDVLFGKLRPYLAKVTWPKRNGVCVGEFLVLRPRDDRLRPAFLELVLRSRQVIDAVDASTFGAKMPRADWRFVGGMALAFPPAADQDSIALFLDHMDRRIHRYIRGKQKLLKLLEEQKQAIVHLAVTRGLDSSVPLRSSGADWLGEVPEHWEVRRAKHLFRELDVRSATGSEVLLSLRMYRGLVPHRDVSAVPTDPEALIGYKKVEPGQIVMNRMRAAIGMFGIAARPGIVSPDYAILEPIGRVNPEYFLRLFRTPAAGAVFRIESKGLGTGSSGFMRLYTDRFGTIKLPLPPEREQARIVRTVANNTQELEDAQDRAGREIALLEEYRHRLIADVVTGKLDVREPAARLQNDDDPQPLQDIRHLAESEEETADDLEPVPGVDAE